MAEARAPNRGVAPAIAPAVLLGVAVLALVVFYYYARTDIVGVFTPVRGWTGMTGMARSVATHAVLATIILAVVPVLVAKRTLHCSLADLGLGLGDWRKGLLLMLAGIPLAVLAGWIASSSAIMRAVYPLATESPERGFVPYALLLFLYFGAWEVLFRGVLLFGLKRSFGEWGAIASQTGLSVTAHFGRAISETVAAFPSGILFGWITLRVRSIWYIAVIHWTVGASMEWFIGWP